MNRSVIFRRCALGALLSCMLGVSFLAQAQQGRFNAAEVASLPQYCQDKLSKRNSEKWSNAFGRDNWLDFHHFCYGLIFMSRASTEIDGQRRQHNYAVAIDNFNYVLRSWPANFSFYQQALMFKEQCEIMRKVGK